MSFKLNNPPSKMSFNSLLNHQNLLVSTLFLSTFSLDSWVSFCLSFIFFNFIFSTILIPIERYIFSSTNYCPVFSWNVLTMWEKQIVIFWWHTNVYSCCWAVPYKAKGISVSQLLILSCQWGGRNVGSGSWQNQY